MVGLNRQKMLPHGSKHPKSIYLQIYFGRNCFITETLSLTVSCRNQSIDLPCKSMDEFLYDTDLRHEKLNGNLIVIYIGEFNYCLCTKGGRGVHQNANKCKQVYQCISIRTLAYNFFN